MPLINASGRALWWRAFNPDDTVRLFGTPGFEGQLPPGGSAATAHPRGQFQLELRDRSAASVIPPSVVLVAAGAPHRIGRVFRASDVITISPALALEVQTQVTRVVPGFLPSTSGFKFANSFPPNSPHLSFTVLGATLGIGDAANGLCGGMVYAARDYFQAGMAPPANTVAPVNGVLFDHLVQRLWHSFSLPGGPLRYLELMRTSTTPAQLAHATLAQAWPQVQADIDAGRLSPLGLIMVRSDDATQMGLNHQVLAYGYSQNGHDVVLRLYDPNNPGIDDVSLSFSTFSPTSVNPRHSHRTDGAVVHAFFRHDYQFVQPPPPQNVPPSASFPTPVLVNAGTNAVIDGNGWLGLWSLTSVVNGQLAGTVYGNTFSGQWDASARTLRFTRNISPTYRQHYEGRLDAANGLVLGSFREENNGVMATPRYAFRLSARLLLEANGWPGEIRFTRFDPDGTVAGRIYNENFSGHWNRSTQQLTLERLIDANYRQRYVGRRTHGLDFEGSFREVVGGVERPTDYRWLARERKLQDSRLSVRNGTPQAISLRLFTPTDTLRAVALNATPIVVGAGQLLSFDIPFTPVLLRSAAVVCSTGAEAVLGLGDSAVLRPDNTLVME